MRTKVNMFLFDIEHFLSDIRGPRYLHLKMVYFFVGHPVYRLTAIEVSTLQVWKSGNIIVEEDKNIQVCKFANI